MTASALSEAERARLAGLDESALARALAVYTGDGEPAKGTPAVAGSHAVDAEGLHFRPLFPFVPGLRYTVRLDLGGAVPLVHGFEVAAASGEAPRVIAVFPSGGKLPENTLRAYLHFSQVMDTRDAHRLVRLEREDGSVVPLAFVEIPHGLWDPGRTRLTVLFHPGRIKKGVEPGERLGLPLRAGKRYRLVVDRQMRDVSGRPLGRDFAWPFEATAADREPPRAAALRVREPGGGREPLVVELPEPLDEALLHRWIWVEDEGANAVSGAAAIAAGETRWSFEPEAPWSPGRYVLRVQRTLEDRAGNRFDRPFDRTLATREPATEDAGEPLRIEFAVRGE